MKLSRAAAVAVMWALVAAWSAGTAAAAAAPPQWAPAAEATIHPGVSTTTGGGQCTANFVFFDGTDIYIGQAAHCSSLGGANEVNGCETEVLPVGTPVDIGGASRPGTVVYNSWVEMQTAGESNEDVCFGNDFALVRIDRADHGKINPSVPFWGGPSGLDGESSFGESVYAYGNSPVRLGISAISPMTGIATGSRYGGWYHNTYTLTPGIPGDSGSAYLGEEGGAMGALSTIDVVTASNNVSDLGRALNYMRMRTDLDAVQLANGTEPFSPLL